jgi:hypothetical protein
LDIDVPTDAMASQSFTRGSDALRRLAGATDPIVVTGGRPYNSLGMEAWKS